MTMRCSTVDRHAGYFQLEPVQIVLLQTFWFLSPDAHVHAFVKRLDLLGHE